MVMFVWSMIILYAVAVIVYCYIWKYILDDFYDSFDDSILYQTVLTIWIVLHVIGIVTAVVWAWC